MSLQQHAITETLAWYIPSFPYINEFNLSFNHKDKSGIKMKSVPFFPLCTCGRLYFYWGLPNLFPVGAEGSTATLLIALHHGTFCVVVRIAKDLLEKCIEGAVTSHIWVFLGRSLLLRV